MREKVEALEKINNRIISCQATIEKPQKNKESNGLYRVRFGRYKNLELLINNAFKVAIRRLENLKEKKCVRAKMRSRRNRYDNLTFQSFPNS